MTRSQEYTKRWQAERMTSLMNENAALREALNARALGADHALRAVARAALAYLAVSTPVVGEDGRRALGLLYVRIADANMRPLDWQGFHEEFISAFPAPRRPDCEPAGRDEP